MRASMLAFGSLLWLLSACDKGAKDLAKDGPLAPLQMKTASEFAALLTSGGEVLCQSGSANFAFTAAGQRIGIPLTLQVGDLVDAVTAGDPLLDTTLFLFGPRSPTGFYGELPLAMDDDSAGGGLSRLHFATKTAGDYILVVSTYREEGIGEASVAITVNGAAGCAAQDSCDDGDPCTQDAHDPAVGCLHTWVYELCAVDQDTDNDGIIDTHDNCVGVSNADQADANGDGYGDACAPVVCATDSVCGVGQVCMAGVCVAGNCDDGDPCTQDAPDAAANCVHTWVYELCAVNLDVDGDGILDANDNCVGITNADQIDTNGDGIGDACAGLGCATSDACAAGSTCQNGVCIASDCDDGNVCTADAGDASVGCTHTFDPMLCDAKLDTDLDGILDSADNCASVANPDQADANNDGTGDACAGGACVTSAQCAVGQSCQSGACVAN